MSEEKEMKMEEKLEDHKSIVVSIFSSPYGEEEVIQRQLLITENSLVDLQYRILILRARLADLAELKVS